MTEEDFTVLEKAAIELGYVEELVAILRRAGEIQMKHAGELDRFKNQRKSELPGGHPSGSSMV